MNLHTGKKDSGMFYVKLVSLLLITIALFIFFTIPFLKTLKAAVVPSELQASSNQVKELETELDVARSRMLMGAGDENTQEKYKKLLEDLERQLAAKEIENRNLQASVQTILQLVKSPGAPPVPDFWQKTPEIFSKIIGCIGSIFSGALFVITWWKRRRETELVG